MDFNFSIIWPQEEILVYVVYFLWLVAGAIFLVCLRLIHKIWENMGKLKDLSTEDSIRCLENSLRMTNISYSATFEQFETDNGKNATNEAIFEHLRTIYDAGRKSSRLDADLLVKNTIDKICSWVDPIKSGISLFLVIGILGTLLGLGISIGSFNGDSFIITGQANNTALELSKLFGNLRGAFAPSMFGVTLTIVFVIFYSIVIQELCINKLTDILTTNTLKVWLPSLYPTDFQKGENTMVRLNETIRNADQINQGASDLLQNLNMANATIRAMNEVSSAISQSAAQFEASSKQVINSEEAIVSIIDRIETTNKNALDCQNKGHEKLIAQADALQDKFEKQSTQLNDIVKTLQSYDETTFNQQVQLNKKLSDAINNTEEASSRVNNAVNELELRNAKIVDMVGVPLNQQLGILSDTLTGDLVKMTEQIAKVSEKLGEMQQPLIETERRIESTFGNILQTMFEKLGDNKGNAPTSTVSSMQSMPVAVNTNPMDTSKLEAKLDAILKCLQEQQKNANGSMETESISVQPKLEAKFDAILECLQEQQKNANGSIEAENISVQPKKGKGTFDIIERYMPTAVIILLGTSIVVQVLMLSYISK